ncbi:MAG: aspartate--tRNA ligase [Clostridia bacterium]|nr:aspartate--tRNA ligase [Clostridia bacterium]
MLEKFKGIERTEYCGEFTEKSLGKEVIAMGWVATRRDFGDLVFVDLRDRTGKLQVVFDKSKFEGDYSVVDKIRSEFVLCVYGPLCKRDEDTIDPKSKTGYIEIRAKELKILSTSEPVPFQISDEDSGGESLKLKYRFLDLRRESVAKKLYVRHEVCKIIRDYFDKERFLEVETPILGKSTPEGARDYLVPSRMFPNKFFALPQSPQLYKQLLMVSGIDRYYQIAKCFRDEDLRADRQPEFTQLDMEMSFVTEEEQVMGLIEKLIVKIFKDIAGYDLGKLPRMTWDESMRRFGTDKPDTRFGLELIDISDIAKDCTLVPFKTAVQKGGSVRVISGKGMFEKLSRTELEKLVTFVKGCGAPGMSYITFEDDTPKSPLLKFFTEEQMAEIIRRTDAKKGDVVFFVADEKDKLVLTSLGKLRLHLAEMFDLIDKSRYDALWIVDFPQFEYSDEESRFVACHHPFTCPKDEDVEYLFTDPARVRAKAYDIVVNGYELGGGSIRIHDQELQAKMFKALGFDEERVESLFGFFLRAFKYGAPPHGGLAFGLDRLVMLLTGTTDIKSVIAFPKVQTSADLVMEAPDFVSQKQIDDVYIDLIKPVEE